MKAECCSRLILGLNSVVFFCRRCRSFCPRPSAVCCMGSWMAHPPATAAVTHSSGVSFPHRRQIKEWDCGATCAYSILRGLDDAARAAATANAATADSVALAAASSLPTPPRPSSSALLYGEVLHALSPCDQRIWTIDLAYLLCSAGVRGVRMMSAQLGVDPAHGLKPFYDHFSEDQRRVERVFAAAAATPQLTVQQQRISASELAQAIRGGHCAILLVDQRFINCDRCYTAEQQRERMSASEFAGHFILCVSVDDDGGSADRSIPPDPLVRFIDPDAKHAPCAIRLSALDRARISDGTDEDCILVDCAQNTDVRISLKGRMAIGLESGDPKAKTNASQASHPQSNGVPSGTAQRKPPGSSSKAIMPSLNGEPRRSTRRATKQAEPAESGMTANRIDDADAGATTVAAAAAAAAAAAPASALSSSAAVSVASVSSIEVLPAGSMLAGLSKADLKLLRAKQSRIRASVARTQGSLPGGAVAPLSLRTALSSSVIFAQAEAGSGVCVHPAGWILTCAHCIGESSAELKANKHKWLLFSSSQAIRTTCVVWDEKRDLALLRITTVEQEPGVKLSSFSLPPFPYVSLSHSSPPLNSPLVCIGQPGSEDLEVDSAVSVPTHYALVHISEGHFRGMVPHSDPHDNHEIGTFKHDAWTYWGHSGAPLLARPQEAVPVVAAAAASSAAASSTLAHPACAVISPSSSSVCPLLVGLHSSWDDETGMRHGVPHAAIQAFLHLHLPPMPSIDAEVKLSGRARPAPAATDGTADLTEPDANAKRARRTQNN